MSVPDNFFFARSIFVAYSNIAIAIDEYIVTTSFRLCPFSMWIDDALLAPRLDFSW